MFAPPFLDGAVKWRRFLDKYEGYVRIDGLELVLRKFEYQYRGHAKPKVYETRFLWDALDKPVRKREFRASKEVVYHGESEWPYEFARGAKEGIVFRKRGDGGRALHVNAVFGSAVYVFEQPDHVVLTGMDVPAYIRKDDLVRQLQDKTAKMITVSFMRNCTDLSRISWDRAAVSRCRTYLAVNVDREVWLFAHGKVRRYKLPSMEYRWNVKLALCHDHIVLCNEGDVYRRPCIDTKGASSSWKHWSVEWNASCAAVDAVCEGSYNTLAVNVIEGYCATTMYIVTLAGDVLHKLKTNIRGLALYPPLGTFVFGVNSHRCCRSVQLYRPLYHWFLLAHHTAKDSPLYYVRLTALLKDTILKWFFQSRTV